MKILKTISIFAVIVFLGASCNLFGGGGSDNSKTNKQAGVLRSANGGTDWQAANSIKDKADATLAGTNVSGMKFKPNSTDVIYMSSSNKGMFVSEDGGNSWRSILSDFSVYDFTFDPYNADIIYIAGMSLNYGRVLVTKDAGKTWQEIYNEGVTGNPVKSILAETSQRLYIGLESGNLVKSEDSGLSWKLVHNFKNRVGPIKTYNGSLYVMTKKQGLYKSADGLNFTGVTYDVGQEKTLVVFNKSGDFNNFVLGLNTIYLATANGLFHSLDQGATWAKLVLPVQDQSATILALGVSPATDSVVYTAVKSTIYKTTDGGSTWQTQNANTQSQIGSILVHPQNQQVVYAGAFNK